MIMMKRSRLLALALALAAVMLAAGGAWAADKVMHPEQVIAVGNKVYGLANFDDQMNYDPAKLIEFDADMKVIRSIDITEGGASCLNANNMVYYNNKLYITCHGGAQQSTFGSIWSVAIDGAALTPKKIFDSSSIEGDFTDATYLGPAGMAVNPSSGRFAVAFCYIDNMMMGEEMIYFPTAAELDAGNLGDACDPSDDGEVSMLYGYDYGIVFANGKFWSINGACGLTIWDPNESDPCIGTIDETRGLTVGSDSGMGFYSLAPVNDGVFAALVDNVNMTYTKGAIGRIATPSGDDPDFEPIGTSASYGGDIAGFAFSNGGAGYIFLNQRNSDPKTWARLKNNNYVMSASSSVAPSEINVDVRNVHGMSSSGSYLYVAAYENITEQSNNAGEFVRINMSGGYTRDKYFYNGKSYPEENDNPSGPAGGETTPPEGDEGDGGTGSEPDLPSFGEGDMDKADVNIDGGETETGAVDIDINAPTTITADQQQQIAEDGGFTGTDMKVEPISGDNAVASAKLSEADALLKGAGTEGAGAASSMLAGLTLSITKDDTAVVFTPTFNIESETAPTAEDFFTNFDIRLTFTGGFTISFNAHSWLRSLVSVDGVNAKSIGAMATGVPTSIADYVVMYHAAMPEAIQRDIDGKKVNGLYSTSSTSPRVGVVAKDGKLLIYDGGTGNKVALTVHDAKTNDGTHRSSSGCAAGAFAPLALVGLAAIIRRRK